MQFSNKKTLNIGSLLNAYGARRRRTLSWLGFGPVGDWAFTVFVSFVLMGVALYYGWSLYSIESQKDFLPQQQVQPQSLRRQVETAIRFYESRKTSITEAQSREGLATTTSPVPPRNVLRENLGGTQPTIR